MLSVSDTTENAAVITQRWHDARAKREEALRSMESPETFEGVQRFLACVHELTSEKRLLRRLYVAQKPG